MKKENFVSMILGALGGLLFALGMCMSMLTEWNTFKQGILVGAAGLLLLLLLVPIRRNMQGKKLFSFRPKTIAAILLGLFGALVFGVGMCMTLVWQSLLVPGILVGILGIVLLLALIPFCLGIRK